MITNKGETPEYVAIMTQTGTATPLLTEYKNTIGTTSVIVNSTGEYELETDKKYKEFQTIVEPFGTDLGGVIPFWNTTAYDYFYTIQWMSPSRIRINVVKASDLSPANLSDVGTKILIKIKVYPKI